MNISFLSTHQRQSSPLDNAALLRMSPSIFAEGKHYSRGDRYGFIPTARVIDGLREAGWFPVAARDQRVRLDDRRGFTRHIVRLRRPGDTVTNLGDLIHELVLLNSHDGTSAYQLHAGVFRLACLNGLIVADSTLAKISIRHSGDVVNKVIEGTSEIVREIPRLTHEIREMQAVQLNDGEREAFARAALELRDSALPVAPVQVLRPRRYADNSRDLWTTFNVVQENLTKGGLHSRTATGRRAHTRAVTSIDTDTKLNKALWTLTQAMQQAKQAA